MCYSKSIQNEHMIITYRHSILDYYVPLKLNNIVLATDYLVVTFLKLSFKNRQAYLHVKLLICLT